jgi:hypothetical protein
VTPFVAKVIPGLPDFNPNVPEHVGLHDETMLIRRALITSDPGCFNEG